MLSLISPVPTPWHRLPAGAKLLALAVFSVVLAFLGSAPALLAAALVIAALHLPGGWPLAAQALRMLRPLWPFVLVLMVWGWWEGRPGPAALVALRMAILVAAANLVTMTTRLSDMLAVFERLATPLSPLIPPRRIALAFALMIRFIPAMAEAFARLREAFRARSPRRPGWRLLTPAILASLDTADQAAEALRARGGAE